jgi:hypothetical protein
MKVFRYLAAALIAVVALCGLAIAQDVHTDYDHHANFERYHTYSWIGVKTDNPLWEQRIQDAVDKELQSKGWQRVESGGDVAISAVGAVKNQKYYHTFYDGMGGWRWGGFGTEATTTVENERIGTVILDMYDASTKQLIFRGVARDTLSDKPEKNENKLQKAVDKMFKDFPPKPREKK